LAAQEKSIQDSLSNKMNLIKQLEKTNINSWISNADTKGKLINAKEIVKYPTKTYSTNRSDSANKKNADSLVRLAKLFIALYEKSTAAYHALSVQIDSLKKDYKKSTDELTKFQSSSSGNMSGVNTEAFLKNNPVASAGLGKMDKWMLGIKNFGIGRNTINYSELTVKNISLTGVNFEYNTWYYLAGAAGSIDYRYTDFLVSPAQKIHQHLYVGRIGIGRIEKNYFILTAFRGEKQLFAGTTTGNQFSTIGVSGLSVESKWQLGRNEYLIGEVAQSFSPNFLSTPPQIKNSWSLSDKSSKAWSLKYYTFLPKTSTKIEALYQFMGANFQAFNSFQTNAQYVNWYVKAEQSLLNKKLKILASLRTNDFSNPYIIQDYKSNTILKTISASFTQKGWPLITAAYMPMSQLTVVGNQVLQNQFETFNSSIVHFYTIGQQRVATNIIFTKFYNSSADTGFIYYNSANLYLGHTLFFNHVTGNITVSYSENSSYRLVVMDENFNFQLSKKGSIGGGVKINNLNQSETKLGGYLNASFRLNNNDMFYCRFDNGFLPGSGNKLVRNTMGNISFTKSFR
ncbi:MAG TPA: hypothetical protein VK772_02750, partial [Puia sp.]|nr:hypothetical protein [Puia sp.]